MSFYPLLPLLPVRYKKDDQNQKMLDVISDICEKNIHRALYLIEDAFSDIFGKEAFENLYQEHQRLVEITLKQASKMSIALTFEEKDKYFADIAQSVFESTTNKLSRDNNQAFRMFLSLLRRKSNIEANDKYNKDMQEGRRKSRESRYRTRNSSGQGSLFR